MKYIGIDIGSTSAKTAVMNEQKEIEELFVIPTGWSSVNAVNDIKQRLEEKEIDLDNTICVSTGYGRQVVDFARKKVTEITCHAKGASYLFGEGKMNVIDIGGQDTKVISCFEGRVEEFFMNDKCSAGTGKFIEIMANRLGVSLEVLDEIARKRTQELSISSMCTVFAESEVIALVGQGSSKENIAFGVLDSVVRKIRQEYSKLSDGDREIYITGGLCDNLFFQELLEQRCGKKIRSEKRARFAGAIGAALLAAKENA